MKIKSLIILVTLSGLTVGSLQAQVKKNTNKSTSTVKNTVVKPFQLLNTQDSLSYALGVDIAKSLKDSGFDLNSKALSEGLIKFLSGSNTLIQPDQTSSIISNSMIALKSKPGKDFLIENKKKPNIHVTAEGLQYEILVQGTGAYPTSKDDVVVHYVGTLIDGEKFDSSYDRNEPLTLNLERVIEGWKLGIPLMRIGSKYRFFIPYNLAYGERATGSIPAFSTLIFDVELLGVNNTSGI